MHVGDKTKSFLRHAEAERPEAFASASLFACAHAVMARYTLALPVRRFVDALFDRVSFADKSWGALQQAPAAGAGGERG